MHRALQIPEVLANIFCLYFATFRLDVLKGRKDINHNLAVLARTCRAFKEPALDILWSELDDPSPLSRCLPEISHQVAGTGKNAHRKFYSFTRPLEPAEWDLLCSYSRRVWCIHDGHMNLDWESVRTSMDFAPANQLFPSLRSLYCDFTKGTIPLLRLPLPSLIRLNINIPFWEDVYMLQDSLRSLSETSPNIKDLIFRHPHEPRSSEIILDGICGWSNLRSVACYQIPLDVKVLVHLSRMPTLTWLASSLSTTFLAQTISLDSPSFTTLTYLSLGAESLEPISRLLSWIRLPSIADLTVMVDTCPSKKDLSLLMENLQTASMGHTIRYFHLEQVIDDDPSVKPNAPTLGLDDLRPCMSFPNLRHMNIDIHCYVDLPDEKLLTLSSAWPHLESLLVNVNYGWNRPGGITPNGLASLLQTCPSLTRVALVIDTRGFTQLPARQYQHKGTLNTLSFAHPFSIEVLDSVIEEESVDAMAVLLSSVGLPAVAIIADWVGWSLLDDPELDLYRERWENVEIQANAAIRKRIERFPETCF